MKLSSIVYGFRSRFVGSLAFLRYVGRGGINPFTASGRQLYYYAFLRFVTQQADRIDLPGTNPQQKMLQNDGSPAPPKSGNFLERQLSGLSGLNTFKDRLLGGPQSESQETSAYLSGQAPNQQNVGVMGNKIDLDRVDQLSSELLDEEEKLPLLNSRRHIQGRRGRYRVTHYLGRRGLGRLYEGVQINDSKVVIIKEFLLPGHIFNRQEIQRIKQQFEKLAGVNIIDRTQDFRLIGAYEAIADDQESRCYLVTRGRDNFNTTLRDSLSQNGAMTARQVHGVLSQVLQTLEFLHSHKFRLGDANLQRGLTHQNIGLDSLLYFPCVKQDLFSDQQFFIYVTDLGIWEHLFHDPKTRKRIDLPSEHQPHADLADLGRLGFHLLLGRDRDENTDQLLDPRNQALWPATDESLKQFMFQLLGLNGRFDSAEEARLALPPLPSAQITVPKPDELEKGRKSGRRWQKALWILGGVAALGVVGGTVWWGVSQFKLQQDQKARRIEREAFACCIQKLDFPTGKFTYGSEQNGLWHYILRQPGLISLGKTLEADLKQRAAKFQLDYQPQASLETSLAKLRNGALDFVVTSLPINTSTRSALDAEFEVQPIAYDGVSVVVAFSDVHRDRNVARSLKGMISFDQLRKLYTGKVNNWKELGGPDLSIKLYMPTDPKLVQIFEARVFEGHEEALAQFRQLQSRSIVRTDATQTLRVILNDFEEKDMGSIGFDSLSKVFGQCSVYPLGISGDRPEGVQALVQDNGNPITPRSDLCDDKGSYWLSSNAFTQTSPYPLRYDIAVIYPKGGNTASPGKKFTDLWRTLEGQALLGEAGLVPLLPLNKSESPR